MSALDRTFTAPLELSSAKGGHTFVVAAQNTKVVALGVGEDHPAGAVGVAAVGDLGGAQRENPLDLVVSPSIDGREIQVDSSVRLPNVVDLDEVQPVAGLWVQDHAFLVAGLIRVVGQIDVSEDRLPPLR